MNSTRTVTEHRVMKRGIDNGSFFPGCGVRSESYWDTAIVGIGDNPHEALADALKAAAHCEYDADNIPNDLPTTPSAYEEELEALRLEEHCTRQTAADILRKEGRLGWCYNVILLLKCGRAGQ